MHTGEDDPALYFENAAEGCHCDVITTFETVFGLHGDAWARHC